MMVVRMTMKSTSNMLQVLVPLVFSLKMGIRKQISGTTCKSVIGYRRTPITLGRRNSSQKVRNVNTASRNELTVGYFDGRQLARMNVVSFPVNMNE